MQLLSECIQALKYPAFWNNTNNPSLKGFLEFRSQAGDLDISTVEHNRYSKELNTISKYYAEASEFGKLVRKWKNDFKDDKNSKIVKLFWDMEHIVIESELVDKKSKLQWKEGILEFERTGLRHLQETSSAVQEKQISSYTSYERNTSKSLTQTKKGESSAKMILREKRRVSYIEPETDSDTYEEKKPKKPKRVGSTSNAHLKSAESPQPVPRTPPQAPRDLSPLMNTPNKRPLESSEIQRYSKDISVVCAFNKTVLELASEVGEELAIELSSIRDTNPALWSHALEKYLDTSLKETGKKFKTAIQVEVPNEPFRLYCEKVLLDFYNLVDINSTMDRNIGERKFITYQISSILKFYERTFLNLNFDWIESHASSAKVTKSATNSGIVKVDSKATRHLDGQEIWHMEVAGGPCKTTDLHTLGDTKKTMRMDVLNLIGILRNHFDCDIKLATKIKVFCTQVIGARMTLYALSMLPDGRFLSTELATALIPFSFQGRSQYKALLRLMAIFHDEIIKQEELMGEIERSILRSKGRTVRHVLNIPDELF